MQQKDNIFPDLDWLGIFRKILDLVEEERMRFQEMQGKMKREEMKREKVEDENKASSSNKFVTTEELSEFLRVPKSWIYDRTYRNAIPHYKLGKHLRFDLNRIQEWLAEHRND